MIAFTIEIQTEQIKKKKHQLKYTRYNVEKNIQEEGRTFAVLGREGGQWEKNQSDCRCACTLFSAWLEVKHKAG